MSGSTIRIGIIGAGQIGKQHLETYMGIPGVEVVAIAGRNPGRTEQVARDYHIEWWTTDFRLITFGRYL